METLLALHAKKDFRLETQFVSHAQMMNLFKVTNVSIAVQTAFHVIQDQDNAKHVRKVSIYRMVFASVKMDSFTIKAAINVPIVMKLVKLA